MVKRDTDQADTNHVRYPDAPWPQDVAHAIHDGPMQTIVSVALELDALARAIGSDDPPSTDEIRGSLWQFRAANQDAAKDLRVIVRRLSEGTGPDDPEGKSSGFEPQLVPASAELRQGDAGPASPSAGGAGVQR